MPSTWERFRATFSLDLRALALLRVALGLMLLVDLAIRVVDLPDHYTDAGILPRVFHESHLLRNHPGMFSLHMLSGELPLQMALAALAAIAAVAVTVGFQTQSALLASLILFISIQNRNNEIETGGDYVLRLVCFWCLFLPMGARFSLDRRSGRVRNRQSGKASDQYFSIATVALILQMMVIYFFSALHKDHPIWTESYTAIHYALHIDAYDTALGEWLRQFPTLTKLMTRGTLVFEFAAPWFLVGAGILSLIPGFQNAYYEQSAARTAVVVAFSLFHLSLAASLSLGTFPWFSAVVWLGFFPTQACNKFWTVLSRAAGTSGPAIQRALSQRLVALRDVLRKNERPFLEPRTGTRGRWTEVVQQFRTAFVGLCIVLMILWNIGTLDGSAMRYIRGSAGLPTPDFRVLIDLLRLDQHWGLFAPYPRKSDGYYVVVAELSDGREIDLLSPGFELTWKKPDDVSGSYRTFRWRKYFRNLRRDSHRPHRKLYSDYACNRYNRLYGGDNPAKRIEIYFMRRKTRLDGGHTEPRKERIWRQGCSRTVDHTRKK